MELLMCETGSDGNVSVITDGETYLQIDCGINYKKANKLCKYQLFNCKDVVITHRHS